MYTHKIYAVGGSVRDEILGKKPSDFDYAVEAPSFEDMSDLLVMNAIALDELGNYYDPFGGYDDIQCRQIVCVGNPRDRFEEDGLRII